MQDQEIFLSSQQWLESSGRNIDDDNRDTVGNELKKAELLTGVPVYQQIRIVGTQANEFYAYYDGYIYHIGYSIDREKNDSDMQEKMLNLVREYILAISE